MTAGPHIKVWRPEDAPTEFDELRTHDDVDWVILVPAELVDSWWEGAFSAPLYYDDLGGDPDHVFADGSRLYTLTHA